ncbi:MAG: DUF1778 domain-containing protein [Thiotrichales bacterium]|nr:DUF1778 domain-containing protein [Thiotrichales bacterium]
MNTQNLPRITVRVDLATQTLLNQAAVLSGARSLNDFVLQSAVEKAQRVLKAQSTVQPSATNTTNPSN